MTLGTETALQCSYPMGLVIYNSTMLKYIPVPIADHETILGPDFNKLFAQEMHEYYVPFLKKKRIVQIAKETWEYAVADSIPGAVWVGAGKNVVDVDAPNSQIDVKGISIKEISNNLTTEASFLQNNKEENDNFATLFKTVDLLALKKMFVDKWLEKVQPVSNLHLLAAIRAKKKNEVYYCLLKLVDDGLTEEDFVAKMALKNKRSVSVPMIDSEYGDTYIYVPKRRLEIRLNCDGLKDYMVYSHKI